MATKVSGANGNWSTAGTRNSVSNTETMHASTNVTRTDTVAPYSMYTAPFTAPNITGNKSTGCALFMVVDVHNFNLTATLQEDAGAGFVDVAGATATITITNAIWADTWIYFRWTTPYAYTVATANKYRVRVNTVNIPMTSLVRLSNTTTVTTPSPHGLVTGDRIYIQGCTPTSFNTVNSYATVTGPSTFTYINSGTDGSASVVGSLFPRFTFAADSGGTTPCFMETNDITGVPANTDKVYIFGHNLTTPITVTVDGTRTIGNSTNSAVMLQRTLLNEVSVAQGGVIVWDNSVTSLLNCKGDFAIYPNGQRTMVQPDATKTMTLKFTTSAGYKFGYTVWNYGKCTLTGALKPSATLWKAKYVSGVGTAVSPLVVDTAVSRAVNDELAFSATNGRSQTEVRYIKTVNSPTSYVLSTSKGGAEVALTYTHTTDAHVVNIERNIYINTNSATYRHYGYLLSQLLTDMSIAWIRVENAGTADAGKLAAMYVSNGTGAIPSSLGIDYVVFYKIGGFGLYRSALYNPSSDSRTFNGLVSVLSNTYTAGTSGQCDFFSNIHYYNNFVDCFSLGASNMCFGTAQAFNTYTRCIAVDTLASAVNGACRYFLNGVKNKLVDCEGHLGTYGVYSGNPAYRGECVNCLFGTKGVNSVADVHNPNLSGQDILFTNCSFGSATFVNNYAGAGDIYMTKFMGIDGLANDYRWYMNKGIGYSCGAGLADTTTRTAGSMCCKMSPIDYLIGMKLYMKIPAKVLNYASILGFIKMNAAFQASGTSSCVVNLYLPGSVTPDATQTMPKTDTNWNVFSLYANRLGTTNLYAIVEFVVKGSAGEEIYIDDLYNGTNIITAMDVRDDGRPSPIMFEQLGDANAVWAVATATQNTVGTMGKQSVDTKNETSLIPSLV